MSNRQRPLVRTIMSDVDNAIMNQATYTPVPDWFRALFGAIPAIEIRNEILNLELHERAAAALQPPVNPEVVSEYQNGTPRAL